MKWFLIVLALLLVPIATTANITRLEVSEEGIVLDNQTNLMWQYSKSRKSFTSEQDAIKYANDLRLGGYDDWRIPTLAERWDIVQVYMYKNNGTVNFPKQDTRYWTTETDKGIQPLKIDFGCMCRGDQEVEYKTKGYVRAVRGPADKVLN